MTPETIGPVFILVFVGIGLAVVFLTLCLITVALSVLKRRDDRRRQRTRTRLRGELFERQQRSDPGWERWIDSLSADEREALASVLQHYLRLVEGEQREAFLEVASALGLGERAYGTLGTDDVVPRLRALATLSTLRYPVEIDRLIETCTDTQLTREAAARLLAERREEYDDAAEQGTKLLVWDGTDPLTVYGLQTLSELNGGGETPLFALAAAHATEWSRAVLVQVCTVLEHTQTTDPDVSFEWLSELLEHDEPMVRAAAVRALKQHGWRTDIWTFLDVASLVDDPSPEVRQATYEVLTYWGDEKARDYLRSAVVTETDERCRLVGVRGLVSIGVEPGCEIASDPAWKWLQAELAVNNGQQLPSPETEAPS